MTTSLVVSPGSPYEYNSKRRASQDDFTLLSSSQLPRVIKDGMTRLPYDINVDESQAISDHWGQRKLLLGEIDFITDFGLTPRQIVVYAGSAPGNHIKFLKVLFPNVTFHLYDTERFRISPSRDVIIFRKLFTIDIAKTYRNRNVLFISDIRSLYVGNLKDNMNQREAMIEADMKLQQELVEAMTPKRAMLKFRLSYKRKTTQYLSGELRIQPWAPLYSTEVRLITDGKATTVYDNKYHEDVMFHINHILRQRVRFEVHNVATMNRRYDTCLEYIILRKYIGATQKPTINPIAPNDIVTLMFTISEQLGIPDRLPFDINYVANNANIRTRRISQHALSRANLQEKAKQQQQGQQGLRPSDPASLRRNSAPISMSSQKSKSPLIKEERKDIVGYKAKQDRKDAVLAVLAAVLPDAIYLDRLKYILDNGTLRPNRTGIAAISVFGMNMKFKLTSPDNKYSYIPLLQSRRIFWKGIVEELLWMIRGETDSKILESRGVNIWKGNTSRQFLDNRGLHHYKEGDIGALYGGNWRHYGADYKGADKDYSGQGVDQLRNVIDKLIYDPMSRSIMITAYNPAMSDRAVLDPCHMFMQFYAGENNTLDCQVYQRSMDVILGCPFNIASYALLTHIIADAVGRTAGDLLFCVGDAHVYENHAKGAQEQLARLPLLDTSSPPYIVLNKSKIPTIAGDSANGEIDRATHVDNIVKNIESYTFGDISLRDYSPMEKISFEMAV